MIVLRKPPAATEATRKALHAQASRKQKTLDPRTLVAAEYLMIGTSLPPKSRSGNIVTSSPTLTQEYVKPG
jgi:hypothetical protein